jgi:chemotaxis regulatin CheY-phosphate phosphatase CheZ
MAEMEKKREQDMQDLRDSIRDMAKSVGELTRVLREALGK